MNHAHTHTQKFMLSATTDYNSKNPSPSSSSSKVKKKVCTNVEKARFFIQQKQKCVVYERQEALNEGNGMDLSLKRKTYNPPQYQHHSCRRRRRCVSCFEGLEFLHFNLIKLCSQHNSTQLIEENNSTGWEERLSRPADQAAVAASIERSNVVKL